MAIWPQLLPELQVRVLSFMDLNELAGTMRLVCKATLTLLPSPKHTTIRLSQRVPPHAFEHRWGQPGATHSLTLAQRLKLLSLTAASGSILNLEFLLLRVGCLLKGEVLAAAAASGQLAMCQWLRQQGCPWDGEVAHVAGNANRREVCDWLIAAGCPGAAACATSGAARGGHVGLLEWLLPQGQPDAAELMELIAMGCDLAALRRLHATLLGRGGEVEGIGGGALPASGIDLILAAAAGSPTPDWRAKVEWLLAAGYPRCTRACAAAAGRRDALDRLAWLRDRGFPLSGIPAWSMGWVAQRAELEALECLIGDGLSQDDGAIVGYEQLATCAAQYGRLGVLQALHERGYVDFDCVHTAAEYGHLSLVAWAVEALGQEVLTPELFGCAAGSGSLELMAWLRHLGCPWEVGAYVSAAQAGCEEALEWLAAHGCPVKGASWAYMVACFQGDLATLACLRRLGCPLDAYMFVRAAGSCALPVLRWLVENGCPVDWDRALEAAGRRQKVEVMAWLEEGRQRAAGGQGVQVGGG